MHITDILLHQGRVSIASMKSRAHHFRPMQWAAVILLALLAISALSAQAPRVAFSVSTFTDLTHPEPAGQIIQDFNQDGHLDLLVTTKLFTGDGTGSLAAAGGFFYAFPSAVATADFNADGYPDVVVTQDLASKQSFYGDICGSTIGIGLFLGPSFSSSRCIATMQRVIAVQTGDFNGDAKPEIAVVSASTSGLWIYSGDYFDSPFSVQITTVTGANVQASSMAPPVDLNRDGTLDLIVGYNGGVKTFLGNGDGTFTASASISATPAGASATVVAAGPLNADGYPDVAWVESGSNGRLLVGLGAANNTFSVQSIATVTTPSPGLADVSIADVDHDGRHDVVVADKGSGMIRIYFGSGDGTFADNRALALSVKPKQLAVADWDKDGDKDLVIVDSGVGGLNAIAWTARQDGSGPTDTTPPAVALTSPALNASVAGRIAVAAVASDNIGVRHVDFYEGDRLIAKSAGSNFIVSWDTTSAPNGAATLKAWAYDAAGNVTTSSAVQVTVANGGSSDTTPPIVTVPAAITAEATGPGGAIVTYAASATDDVDGNIAPTCNPASGTTFPLYHTTVTCTATDAHGNTASASFTIAVHDTTAPVVTVPANATVEATRATGATFIYTASANDAVDGAATATCSPSSGATFALGTTTVACSAADAHGNIGSESFTVTVRDTTPPAVSVPDNAIVQATSANGVAHTFSASAADIVDGAVPPTCTPASGATFAFGPTTIQCTATDAHGNTGSASFTVTVHDTTAPVVTVPENATTEATGASGATYGFNASAVDNIDGDLSTTCSPANGATFALGTTTVTCSASDAHGNTGSASFTVRVVDTIAPIVTVPPNIMIEATSPAGAPYVFSASAADIVDDAVPVSCTPPSGSTFTLGTTAVGCTAIDAHGNSAAAAFLVTVRDTTPPVVTPPAVLTIQATEAAGARGNILSSMASQNLSTFLAGGIAADLGDVAPVHQSPQALIDEVLVEATTTTLFPVGTTTVVFRFRDASGNVGSASSSVTVMPPVGGIVDAAGQVVGARNAENIPQPVRVSFAGVAQPGLLTADAMPAPPPAPAGFWFVGPVYDVVTTALVEPPMNVCLLGNGFPADARVQHYQSGAWVDVTDAVTPTELCATATTLSPFAVMTAVNRAPSADAGASQTVEATSAAGVAVALSGTGSDPDSGETLTFRWSEGATELGTAASVTVTLGLGTHTLTLTVTDSHDESASADTVVTVVDTTAPVVTVPMNATVEATSASGAAYSFSASATDSVDGVVATSCTPASGATFPFGATTVSCTASDAHGNTTSASFTVTVHDTTAPVVTVSDNIVIEATSAAGATHSFTASAVDNIDGSIPTTCAPASGATFPIGTTTVQCSATDARGNTALASFTITVLKMTPLITWSVPADITYGTALSEVELNATANVSGSFVYTPPAGTVLNAGAGQTLSVVFTPADGARYATATVNSNITVLKAIPTIAWAAPGAITYGTVLTGAQLSATANVPGSFAYTPGNGIVLDAGIRTLSAIFTATDLINYASVSATTEVLVTTAALTVIVASHTKTYGAANPTLMVSYSGFVNGDTAASLAIPALVTTDATTSSPVGTYPITASGAVSANYTISYVTGTLTVTRAALTVTANNQTKTYGAANPVLTVTCLGFVNGDTAASLTVQPTVTTTATISSPVGTYPIMPSGAESANYTITHVNGMLTIVASSGPVATDDIYTTTQATALTVASPGVLANDSGEMLTAVLSGAPAHGALVLSANGGFRYAPSTSYIGTDTFRYLAKDSSGTLSSGSTVTITIKSFQ